MRALSFLVMKQLEQCGGNVPPDHHRLLGTVDVRLNAHVVTCHIDMIAVERRGGVLHAVDETLDEVVDAYYKLNGNENPQLLKHGKHEYLVFLYPFAD